MNPILEHFQYLHLPDFLQETSQAFHDLAHEIEESHINNAEKSTTLRKLLEAKDAAVRSRMYTAKNQDKKG